MKWNHLFAGLIYFSSGTASAAIIDINDPNTLVIDSAINWDIFADTTYNYNNILITENGVLDIFGTSSIPNIMLSSAGNIEIYGTLNVQDVNLTLNAVDSVYLSGSVTSSGGFTIQGATLGNSASSTFNGGAIISTDPAISSGSIILVDPVLVDSGTVLLNPGDITPTPVPLPASLWLMLSGLIAFSRFRFS